jgi:hypothetical protein
MEGKEGMRVGRRCGVISDYTIHFGVLPRREERLDHLALLHVGFRLRFELRRAVQQIQHAPLRRLPQRATHILREFQKEPPCIPDIAPNRCELEL